VAWLPRGAARLLVEHRLADEILLAQVLVALQFGRARSRLVSAARRLAWACDLRQAQVLRIELHQHLAALAPACRRRPARADLAADAEAQARFDSAGAPRRKIRR
jgi:hypothetical protein